MNLNFPFSLDTRTENIFCYEAIFSEEEGEMTTVDWKFFSVSVDYTVLYQLNVRVSFW